MRSETPIPSPSVDLARDHLQLALAGVSDLRSAVDPLDDDAETLLGVQEVLEELLDVLPGGTTTASDPGHPAVSVGRAST